ncbi:putative MATE family efflux protein [Sinobaca qinghaiensis]|uniref:Putative MATE family efflux protein n=2 Tax=Sinobaca TaxID=342943 RepID=A0A419V8D6_9BACL|nr:MATE family efflux transporter [Sinobaca qinghaiensis]RKD76322.1 putative MATE family efflux protein [Sinobaca qinghaiensis]
MIKKTREPLPGKKLSLFLITWPIFIEVFLQIAMQFVDVFMISFISDDAVASIGVVNQIFLLTFVLFNFTALGAGVVISQYTGARKTEDISKIVSHAIIINLAFGLFISAVVVLFRLPLLELFNLAPELVTYADTFMLIVGGTLFTQALVMTLSALLQGKGYTKDVMYVVLGMNVLNVFGNYAFIFGAFGFPEWGVAGVALSTVISRVLAMTVLAVLLYIRLDVSLKWSDFYKWERRHAGKILNIGIPSAGEQLSYNGSQLAITIFITTLGAAALSTRVYALNLMALMMIFSLSVGKGMQIYVGQLIGAGEREVAYHQMFRGLKIALLIVLLVGMVLAFSGEALFQLFTSNPDIIATGTILLFIGIILEPGKAGNLIIISALRATGDARYPVLMGMLFMWGVTVPLAYVLGIYLEFGLIGIWIAMTIDEWGRASLMYIRWRSRKWESKALVEEYKETAPVP